jgi:two-component system, chemotaxis family, protein-glutamate methylesterase/glutaminase
MAEHLTVLIVDDSRLFRSALVEALRDQNDIAVVGSVFSGDKALEFIRSSPPDLVTLDVEMPGMDGMAALQQIQLLNQARPPSQHVGVIMVSAVTHRGAQVTIRALQAGAFDFVTKPAGTSAEESLAILRDELLAKIRMYALSRRRTSAAPAAAAPATPPPSVIRRQPRLRQGVRAVVIGTSTGGPRALSVMMPELCKAVTAPILIVQHMPAGFTKPLAESLARQTGRKAEEAVDGEPLEPEKVYIAPGGRHLLIRGTAALPKTGLTDQPPENGCRPAADVLFRSAAAVFGSELIAVIMTGMGQDGTAGLSVVRRAGGYVIAQDEATSVVWGMPGSAVKAGVADEVRPLDQIARAAAELIRRDVPG